MPTIEHFAARLAPGRRFIELDHALQALA